MSSNPVRRALLECTVTVGTWIQIGHPAVAEILADSGFDWLAADCEHTEMDVAEAIESTLNSDNPPFRIPVGKDANEVSTGRAKAGDEAWVKMLCTEGYDDFADAWQAIVGVDYYRD